MRKKTLREFTTIHSKGNFLQVCERLLTFAVFPITLERFLIGLEYLNISIFRGFCELDGVFLFEW